MIVRGNIELPDTIRLVDGQTNQVVLGEVIELDRETAKREIDHSWRPAMAAIGNCDLSSENDAGWVWHEEIGTLRVESGNRGCTLAVRVAGEVQGGIMYEIGCESFIDPSQPAIFVARLATAFWNRTWLRDPPRYRNVGRGLLRLAIWHSYRYGFGGRVTLEAYKDVKLVEWYEKFGFRLVSTDPDGIYLFELTPEAAAPLL